MGEKLRRLALYISLYRPGMQRPGLVWRPDCVTVLTKFDCDDAAVAFSSVRASGSQIMLLAPP